MTHDFSPLGQLHPGTHIVAGLTVGMIQGAVDAIATELDATKAELEITKAELATAKAERNG